MSALHTRRIAHIGLGSNLSHPVQQLQEAFAELDRLPGTRLLRRSSLYRSAPVGKLDQPDFVNAVAEIETTLTPGELLAALLAIEARHGRVRKQPNDARTLDLDFLLWGDETLREPGLEVPHPRMHERAFVLMPLTELDPAIVIPGRGSAAPLLAPLSNQRVVRLDDSA